MEYIKNLFQHFRRNITIGNEDNNAETTENEGLKLDGNSQPNLYNNSRREKMDIDINRIFFGDLDSHSNKADIRSDIESDWPFGTDRFSPAFEMHTVFQRLFSELWTGLPNMEDFMFQDSPEQTLGDCPSCDTPNSDESLRDSYLTVPTPRESAIPHKWGMVTPPGNEPLHNSHTEEIVLAELGPDGILTITKKTRDQHGYRKETVRVNLKDKM